MSQEKLINDYVEITYLDSYIEQILLERNKKEREDRTPSGKLAASRLGWPLQWQILKTIGVPQDPLGEYVIRKFERGNHVEDWLVSQMPGVKDTQVLVEYKGCIGFLDADVDMSEWKPSKGLIPHEIKSVSNASFRWIKKDGPKKGHIWQAVYYAMGLGRDEVAVDYVAAGDYRVKTFLFRVDEYRDKVEEIIKRYGTQIKSGVIPEFEPVLGWQKNLKYNNYTEFVGLTSKEAEDLVKKKYPEAYKKLQELKEVK